MTEESIIEEIGTSRISRRGVIKAGAVVGGTVWVAPVIDSFVSRAAAQSSTCTVAYTCLGNDKGGCNGNSNCACYVPVEGGFFCGASFDCASATTCTASSQCPSGWACVLSSSNCCGVKGYSVSFCAPPCGEDPPGRGSSSIRAA